MPAYRFYDEGKIKNEFVFTHPLHRGVIKTYWTYTYTEAQERASKLCKSLCNGWEFDDYPAKLSKEEETV